jgi:excisionase family DNA binding protein
MVTVGQEVAKMVNLQTFLTVPEVGAELRRSVTSIYRDLKRGTIPSVRIGSKILVSRQFIDRLAQIPTDQDSE